MMTGANNGHGSHRRERELSQLTQLAAQYLAREAGRGTLITATRASLSPDSSRATVFVTIFPESDAQNALAFLARHQDSFRDYLKSESRFPRLPRVQFQIDPGESGSVGTLPERG